MRNKIVHMVTVSKSLVLLRGQIEYLKNKNMNISILTSAGPEMENFNETPIKYTINMKREINIIGDLVSLFKISKLFYNIKPRIVNSGTPKAGLLGMIAAFITRVPTRIYTMRGLKLETARGLKYKILWLMEKICCLLATDIICISPSLQNELVKLKLTPFKKTKVLGKGSSNGINLEKFPLSFDKNNIEISGYNGKKFTIGYIGRLVKDKGINDVIKIYHNILSKGYDVQLLLIGSIEEGDPISNYSLDCIHNDENIIYMPHVHDSSKYYYLIDVFLFLTAREGFGNVSIEAQAASVPVIAYDVTGARDTLIHRKTGFLVEEGDIISVEKYILKFYESPMLLNELGSNAREFVCENFSNEIIWEELYNLYQRK